jgi:hypothetical protein
MDFLNKFTDYILNSEKRFSAKFVLLASVVGGLLFAEWKKQLFSVAVFGI